MREGALQVIGDARHVPQILRLAIALVEAGEDAEYLRGALRGERRIELHEVACFEAWVGLAAGADIAADQFYLQGFGHVHPRILQKRGKIVGGWPHERVLEIEKADPRRPGSLGQPQQIGRMEVAQHPGLRRGERGASAWRQKERKADRAVGVGVAESRGRYQSSRSSISIMKASRSYTGRRCTTFVVT